MPPDIDDQLVDRLRAAGCVFAEDEAAVLVQAATSATDLERLTQLRISGLPLEHIVGWVQFAGHRFAIAPGVFVPRRRTELLAHCAIEAVPHKNKLTVVDLCCGCAAIAATIGREVAGVSVYATDIDPDAIRCARANLRPIGGQAFQGDLYAPLPLELRGNVDVIVANAPYVPTEAIALLPPEAREHEPHTALDGGSDGLDILRRVVLEAPPWLSPAGVVLVEVSERQAPDLRVLAESLGLTGELVTDDEIGGSVLVMRIRTQ